MTHSGAKKKAFDGAVASRRRQRGRNGRWTTALPMADWNSRAATASRFYRSSRRLTEPPTAQVEHGEALKRPTYRTQQLARRLFPSSSSIRRCPFAPRATNQSIKRLSLFLISSSTLAPPHRIDHLRIDASTNNSLAVQLLLLLLLVPLLEESTVTAIYLPQMPNGSRPGGNSNSPASNTRFSYNNSRQTKRDDSYLCI